MSDAGVHFGRGGFHVLDESLEFLIRAGQLAAPSMRSASDLACSSSFVCTLGQEPRVLGALCPWRCRLQLVPGGRDDFLLALRDLLPIVAAATAAATAALLLRLRIVAFEGLGLDEVAYRSRGVARVLGRGVQC